MSYARVIRLTSDKLTRTKPIRSHHQNNIGSTRWIKSRIPNTNLYSTRSDGLGDLVDCKLNEENKKPITNRKETTKPSTSIPLSITTGSPGQSSAIESHPSTSLEDLHPLPTASNKSINITKNNHSHDRNITSSSSLPNSTLTYDPTLNWSRTLNVLGQLPFPKNVSDILMAPINPMDVEIKPDGIIYLPEIIYRRILDKAFGPGGWELAPRGSTHITTRKVSREYGLIYSSRIISIARGEQDYYNYNYYNENEGIDNNNNNNIINKAIEKSKSNGLIKCCKNIGIAVELEDPKFVHWWKNRFAFLHSFVPPTTTTTTTTGLLSSSTGKKKSIWKKKKLDNSSPSS